MATDQQFYDSRAADLIKARDSGDIEAAADVAAQVLIEEGPAGLDHLTDAIKRTQQ